MPAAIHPFPDAERSAAPGALPLARIVAASQKGEARGGGVAAC